ncbi:MAG TPA: glycosyltransferase [Patescibacteria group bacterium]|nr:glycosyltransferase [Patescibacteria group bacterium]
MKKYDLSILIPSRNEMFLGKTIENLLENIEGNTEIIAVLDGAWAEPRIPDNDRVSLIYNSESIGQRAATNQACKLSHAKYVMKVDAHCSFDKGFDVKMIAEMHDDWTMVPLMKNLHAFDWVCESGHRRYQGPSGPCLARLPDGQECGKVTTRDILWHAKDSPKSVSYCFDATPHFQYFGDYAKRPEGKGEITETMSLQGSCFMLTREKYWELGVCDENFGSWGSQGIEVAVKTWLSGGKVMVNKKTWYSHMFRTQGGDFGFPYQISGRDQEKAKSTAHDLFFNDNWPKQVRPLSWLVERFWPVKGWTEEDLKHLKENTFRFTDKSRPDYQTESEPQVSLPHSEYYFGEPTEGLPKTGIIYQSRAGTRGMVFYTDNQLKTKIAHKVQDQLRKIGKDKNIEIVSVSLKPMPHFGDKNIHFPLERGYLTMFKQILAGIEACDSDIVFLCEHDVIYHPSHFDFIPPKKDIFYYNQNWWRVRLTDGFAVHWDANQVSGLCCYREHLLKFYRERVSEVEKNGYKSSMGFEPGGRNTELISAWKSEYPDVDIKHGGNLSKNKWSLEDFRDKSTAKNFITIDEVGGEIPGWGKTTDLVKKFN